MSTDVDQLQRNWRLLRPHVIWMDIWNLWRICVQFLRADVSKYRPEVYKSEKSKILKKIHKVALGKVLT